MARRVNFDHTRQGSAPREPATNLNPRSSGPPRISSAANPQIKAVRALRDRKERDRTGLFFVEGIRAVAAVLEANLSVHQLLVAPDLLESDFARQLIAAARERPVPTVELSASVFETLSRRDGPQGLALVAHQRWLDIASIEATPSSLWVALHQPQDPGNLGSILRTCDAAGAAGLILLGPSADPYDPSALRASTGAAFTIPLARCSWPDFTAWLRREPVHLVGATGAVEDAPTSYRAATYPRPLALLMGSEREGLSAGQRAACDQLVHIPMRGTVDSLNLAVATSLVLYEIAERSSPSS